MKSVLQDERECYVTGRTDSLERHHIFGGPNRKHSEKYGLWVWLTHDLHNEPPLGAHHNKRFSTRLKCAGQRAFEEIHSRAEFMEIFGRNYLD